MAGSRVVVIGGIDAARRACDALARDGHTVTHLLEPSETDLRACLTEEIRAVAVLVRGDVAALRYALLVEHLRPNIRLVVTIFDRTVADQLNRAIPNCEVTSPADIAAPTIVGACLAEDVRSTGVLAIDASDGTPRAVSMDADGTVTSRPWHDPASRQTRFARILAEQARSHDSAGRILLTGLAGLLAALVAEWIMALIVLHDSGPSALYSAARLVSTVGLGDGGRTAPGWYQVVSGIGMMLTIGFAALFTAGVVERSLSTRSTSVLGLRTVPTRGHVVVVGFGQVGLRLCLSLRRLGVPVVAVERDPLAANLRLAKAAGIPVLVAHAEDRAVLAGLHLDRARALAAMGAEELDNVEVAIAALAACPGLRVVLRAGDNDVITETRSLFRIGAVCDISALTARAVVDGVRGRTPAFVCQQEHGLASYPGTAGASDLVPLPGRCSC